MEAEGRVKDPGAVVVTMEFTMTVAKWDQLLAQLDDKKRHLRPASQFVQAVRDLTDKAKGRFGYEPSEEQDAEGPST